MIEPIGEKQILVDGKTVTIKVYPPTACKQANYVSMHPRIERVEPRDWRDFGDNFRVVRFKKV